MDKNLVVEHLQYLLDQKIAVLKDNLETLTEARNNEDKCTVGDKYETGRAMTQMELEKADLQLRKSEDMKTTLSKVDLKNNPRKVEFGALVETNSGIYFFCIPYGKIEVKENTVFCLSPVSPIGKMLLGKTVGEHVQFQGIEIHIKQIN